MSVTEEDIRTLAKRLRDRYGYDRRMSWRSFETEARRSLLLLDEAGLLVTPQASSAERDIEQVAQVLRDCKKVVVRDERDYETFCAKRVLAALRGEAT